MLHPVDLVAIAHCILNKLLSSRHIRVNWAVLLGPDLSPQNYSRQTRESAQSALIEGLALEN